LLAVLQEGEEVYEEWLEFEPRRDQLRRAMSVFPSKCNELANKLQKTLACWHDMGKDNQYALAARGSNCASEQEVAQRFESTLREMILCAQSGSTELSVSWRGRPKKSTTGASLEALTEFTKVIRAFWIDKKIPDAFGFDKITIFDETTDANKGRDEAASAAARLIEGAAKILDPRYTLSNVRQVMESVNRDPMMY
jgi:hypothetical protein